METSHTIDKNLIRTITRIAVILGLLTATSIPGVYLYTATSYESDRIQGEANHAAVVVSGIISRNPAHWIYMNDRVEGALLPLRSGKSHSFRVVDGKGQTVFASADPPSSLAMTGIAPLYDSGVQVGMVEYTESTVHILLRSALTALIGIGLGIAMFVTLRNLPMHALRNSTKSLRNANAEILYLNADLEARIRERTQKVEAQARHLEQALKAQIEYNSMQREFVSTASHEFRTPLTIIDGAAQRVMRKLDRLDRDDILKSLGNIRGAVSRMIELLESVLSAAQIEEGEVRMEPQLFDLKDMLRLVRDRQQAIAPSHKIELDLQDLPETVPGDPRLLEQVFTNLFSNAVKYSPQKSQIDVVGTMEGDTVRLDVRDRGVGIPAADLPRMFQRFFRASTSIGTAGTGIGLNIVKKFVELHGGRVDVESLEGMGSTFTVWLPIVSAQERATRGGDGGASPGPCNTDAAA
jgi:signal transduction histidine kinase